jgi:hypothetical protein
MHCVLLYCTVLYCTVLYCTVLYCIVLYCTLMSCALVRAHFDYINTHTIITVDSSAYPSLLTKSSLLLRKPLALHAYTTCTYIHSISWQITELMDEFTAAIDEHFERLLGYVRRNCWRVNPNVLVGARVAVFRRKPGQLTPEPTLITGFVLFCYLQVALIAHNIKL